MANIKIYEKEQIDRLFSPKANTADFALAGGVPRAGYVSSLFSRVSASAVTVAGVLNNAELEKSIVAAVNGNFDDATTTSYPAT